MSERLRVAVVFGGRSGEHAVSLMSAASIIRALNPAKYDVVAIGITQDGHWWLPRDVPAALEQGLRDSDGQAVVLVPEPGGGLMLLEDGPAGRRGDRIAVDVFFPVLHGPYGEDGTMQGLFELANVPYVGAGVSGSAAAMDKGIMKDLFVRHGLPTPRYRVFTALEWHSDPGGVVARIETDFGYPVFVKPANLGSSVGVHKCRSRDEFRQGMADAALYDRRLIVEEAIPEAREIEISVLGNQNLEVSIPGEIIPSREFYDYRAKYLDGTSQLLIPAPLEADQVEAVQRLAVASCKALGIEGMARVDFLLSRSSSKLYLNEINTIPGFTQISMYPKLWEASGLPYPQLLDRLIELAVERWREKQALKTVYEPGQES